MRDPKMFIRYVIAGAATTVIAFMAYSGIVLLSPAPFWAANLFAIFTAVVWGFLLGNYFVFPQSGRSIRTSGWRFVVSYGVQYILGTTLIGIGIRIGLSEIGGYIAALPIVITLSFFLQRYWVFKRDG